MSCPSFSFSCFGLNARYCRSENSFVAAARVGPPSCRPIQRQRSSKAAEASFKTYLPTFLLSRSCNDSPRGSSPARLPGIFCFLPQRGKSAARRYQKCNTHHKATAVCIPIKVPSKVIHWVSAARRRAARLRTRRRLPLLGGTWAALLIMRQFGPCLLRAIRRFHERADAEYCPVGIAQN